MSNNFVIRSIDFEDKETGKIVKVDLKNSQVVSLAGDKGFTPDEFAFCKFHSEMLVRGGYKELYNFASQKNN